MKEGFDMEKMKFKAESQRLLDMMINSIYTNREIFMRELVSNASVIIRKPKMAVQENLEMITKSELQLIKTRELLQSQITESV